MKISKLLVLGALLLTGTSAMAALVERQKPEPQTTAFATGSETDVYYLYNTSAKLFFTQGNTWGTRACVGPAASAVKVYFAESEAGDGSYYIRDYVNVRSETSYDWRGFSASGGDQSVYCDQSTSWGRPYWTLVAGNGNTFRLKNTNLLVDPAGDLYLGRDDEVVQDFSNAYAGFADDNKRYPLSAELTEGEGHHIDWALVTTADFETISGALAAYDKAQELKDVIAEAQAKGIDVSAAEAVYNNLNSTVEQIEAAIEALKLAINNLSANGATVSNPKDMTATITNPNFDNASAAGWQGTAPNMVGSGSHGPADVAEHYNKTFETYQDLPGMPAGVYMLENDGFYRGSFDDSRNKTNRNGMIYAIADGDTLQTPMANPWDIRNTTSLAQDPTEFGTTATESTTVYEGETFYAPNDPSAARLYFENGYYHNKVFFSVAEGTVRLGVRKAVAVGNDWTVFDSFKLTFFGNEGNAYQYWLDNIDKVDYNGLASSMYVQDYENAFNVSVSNKAGVLAAIANAEAALVPLKRNVELWAEYDALAAKALGLVTEGAIADGPEKEDLGEYVQFNYDEYKGAMDLSNEQLETEIQTLNDLIAAANGVVADGTDVTSMYLKNADFNNGSANWTVGKGTVNFRENIAEAYNTNFDVYQEVAGAAVGVYEVQVQGFFRMDRDAEAYNKYLNGEQKTDAGVYINDNKTNLKCIFDEGIPMDTDEDVNKTGGWMADLGTGFWYPNDMTSAAYAFGLKYDSGNYKYYNNSAYGLVAEEGDVLRIGVKGNVTGANWICFDNIRLIKRGYNASVVKPVLEGKIAEAEEITSMMMTKTAKANLAAALADAKAKVNESDGVAMFKALSELTKRLSEANEANAICKALSELNDELLRAIEENDGAAAVDEASNLYETVKAGLSASTFETSDIENYTAKIREMQLKLRLPAEYWIASETNPKDLTGFIQTPGFQKVVDGAETNSIDGWEGTTGYNFGNNETQKGALALEFYEKTFDMYQDVQSVGSVILPNGEYEVRVNAFERVVDATPAYLYAQSGSNTAQVELMKLADGIDETSGESAPNDMVSAGIMFENGRYLNTVKITVVDHKLRIGIKHEANSGADWIIMDNFKLIYKDTDQTVEQGIETLENDSKQAVKVEYYTIDGRKATATQKGIVLKKMTMSDGSIEMKKVTK